MGEDRDYVLVVDDEDRVAAFVRHALELSGFGTVTAHTEDDAWAALMRERPALAVVDLGLAGGDGWSLIRRLRADLRFAKMPVLVITGSDADDLEERLEELGCGLLRKPFEPDDLVESVRTVMVRPLEVVLLLPTVRITGTLHAPPGALRFSEAWEELFSDSRRFVPITDATVTSLTDDGPVEKVGFMEVAKDQIWGVLPAREAP